MACDRVSAEMATEEGDDNTEVKEDDDVETDVVEGADSPLVDEARPCGSNEAEMLLSVVWRQIFEQTDTKTRKNEKNCSQRRKTKKMAQRNQHEGKLKRANESLDRCSQLLGIHMSKTADLRHLGCS